MLKEFREFLEKFNVIPAAVGMVLALAFQPVVEAVSNVILSLVGALFGAEVSFGQLEFALNGTPIPYGPILTTLLSFLMVAAVVFMVVKSLDRAGARTTNADTPEVVLLREIRDSLQSR